MAGDADDRAVAVVAASYAALLMLFAGFVIVPGITSIRPANAVPVVLGLAFGPAAAWGAAIGNLINDVVTEQFSPASAFGLVVVSIGWLVTGITFSLGVGDVPFGVEQEQVAGQGGALVQVLLGTVAFLELLALAALVGERLSRLRD